MRGFVFKIQANMDPNHRDRIAFMRVCSGKLARGMKAKLVRTGKNMALNAPQFFFAQDRQFAEEAYAGDVVGIPNHGTLRIGDTLTEGEELVFRGVPSFAPEILRRVKIADAMRAKKLREALQQMAEEGVVQVFLPNDGSSAMVGVVGALQLDVLVERLAAEYGLDVALRDSRFELCRWVSAKSAPSSRNSPAPIRPRWRSISTARRSTSPPRPGICATSRKNGRRSLSPTSRIIRRRGRQGSSKGVGIGPLARSASAIEFRCRTTATNGRCNRGRARHGPHPFLLIPPRNPLICAQPVMPGFILCRRA